MIVRQVPHEEAHDTTDDKTSKKLKKSQEMERHSRIMRRRGLRAWVEWLEHNGQGCMVVATGVEHCVVGGGARNSSTGQFKCRVPFFCNGLRCWYGGVLTSVRALSTERVSLEDGVKMAEWEMYHEVSVGKGAALQLKV